VQGRLARVVLHRTTTCRHAARSVELWRAVGVVLKKTGWLRKHGSTRQRPLEDVLHVVAFWRANYVDCLTVTGSPV